MNTTRKRKLRRRGNKKTIVKRDSTKDSPYTRDDFNSGDGFLTSVWGPAMWHYLHTMSFNYPVHPTAENKHDYKDFVVSLKDNLPCKFCRLNLVKNFKELPITDEVMESRETFSKYIYNLHELINKMLDKKSGLTYEEVRDRFEHFRARGCSSRSEKTKKNRNRNWNKELGCVTPLHGKKSKCIIKIVPQETKCDTFQMDSKCVKKR